MMKALYSVIFCTILLVTIFMDHHIVLANERVPQGSEEVEANNTDQVYHNLKNKVKNNWDKEMEKLKNDESTIEIKGDLPERLLRSIINTFYINMKIIKTTALFIGLLSFTIGGIITIATKLNKGLRRFAVGFLMIMLPAILFIFVFGLSILIGTLK